MDVEIKEYRESGYAPVVDYESWRVAVLNDCEELQIENLRTMQKHMQSDEVFVLQKGCCTLFTAGAGEEIATIKCVELMPGKCYNVKKGVWHTHTLAEGSSVLIVENSNTDDSNSPIKELKEMQRLELIRIWHERKGYTDR